MGTEIRFQRLYGKAAGEVIDATIAFGFSQNRNNFSWIKLSRLDDRIEGTEVIRSALRNLENIHMHEAKSNKQLSDY